jgi:hypothetical protein
MSDRRRASLLLAPIALALAACGADVRADQDWRTYTSQRDAAGETELRVKVEYGAGRLAMQPANPGTLYAANIRYDSGGFTPVADYTEGQLRVGIEGSHNMRGRGAMDGHLELQLGTGVPTDLDLAFGAGRAELELGGIPLRRLTVQTGASDSNLTFSAANPVVCESASIEAGAARFRATGLGNLNARTLKVSGGAGDVHLDFTGAWQDDMRATVDVGLGSLTLRFPRSIGVHIARSGALSSFNGQDMVRRGNDFYSEGWETAERRLNLTLNAAIGTVRVVWVDDAGH